MGRETGTGKRWQRGSSEPCVLLPSGTWISGWPWGPPRGCHLGGGIAASLVHYSERPFLCYTCGTASLQRPFPCPPRQMTANCRGLVGLVAMETESSRQILNLASGSAFFFFVGNWQLWSGEGRGSQHATVSLGGERVFWLLRRISCQVLATPSAQSRGV